MLYKSPDGHFEQQNKYPHIKFGKSPTHSVEQIIYIITTEAVICQMYIWTVFVCDNIIIFFQIEKLQITKIHTWGV